MGERIGDGKMLESLVEAAEGYCRIARMILNGVYDSMSNFS